MSVVAAADILGFVGWESQLVHRMVQNIHPTVKSHLLFETGPESIRDLFSLATTVAEAVAVEEQRRQLSAPVRKNGSPRPVANTTIRGRPCTAKADCKRRCWECGASGHLERDCPLKSGQDHTAGKSKGYRRSVGIAQSQAPKLAQPRNILYPRNSGSGNPFVMLRLDGSCLPAMLDSGSSLSFLRRDILDNIKTLGLPYTLKTAKERQLVNGETCVVSEVFLRIKIHSFLWKFCFLVLDNCPIPCILGVDFFNLHQGAHKFLRLSV
jgi:hypothetical protein